MTAASWEPMDNLKRGQYGIGLFPDGSEAGIYADGLAVWNTATGQKAAGVTHWRKGQRRHTPLPDVGPV